MRARYETSDTLSRAGVADLLGPFGIDLTSDQTEQLLTYLNLLQRWNLKINLTAIDTAEVCVTRHFGESLYLTRWVQLQGRNLDVGSGAGFPALALKIILPGVAMTLLEPVSKKRAFLKEVTRICGMDHVEIRPERLENYAKQSGGEFDSVTSRAVGNWIDLVAQGSRYLARNGLMCLWTTSSQSTEVENNTREVVWGAPVAIPGSRKRVIMIGRKIG